MRKGAYRTVKVAQTLNDALRIIGRLRKFGLHPVDLALVVPLAALGSSPLFPVEVPTAEVDSARKVLDRCGNSTP